MKREGSELLPTGQSPLANRRFQRTLTAFAPLTRER